MQRACDIKVGFVFRELIYTRCSPLKKPLHIRAKLLCINVFSFVSVVFCAWVHEHGFWATRGALGCRALLAS